jgi:hypothetical protein
VADTRIRSEQVHRVAKRVNTYHESLECATKIEALTKLFRALLWRDPSSVTIVKTGSTYCEGDSSQHSCYILIVIAPKRTLAVETTYIDQY